MRKPKVTLENWAVIRNAPSPSFEELQPGFHLMGNAIGHADLPRLSFIYTTRISNVDKVNGLVETANTLYRLGEPHEAYKAWQIFEAADSAPEEQRPQKDAA